MLQKPKDTLLAAARVHTPRLLRVVLQTRDILETPLALPRLIRDSGEVLTTKRVILVRDGSTKKLEVVRFQNRHFQDVLKVLKLATEPLKKSNGGLNPDSVIDRDNEIRYTPSMVTRVFIISHKIFLAKLNGVVIGTAGYSNRMPTDKDGKSSATLGWFFVNPDYQGCGIGRILYETVLDQVKGRGYKNISLYAMPGSHGFYERLGLTHDPRYDLFPLSLPYDPEINKGIVERGECQHVDYGQVTRTPSSFFFHKSDI
ncbi:MAG: GNAT family N-acetyltransferase [Candidatus Micrarchaeota archaeon]|nr:GNAT family N-acetyltransferase [Candidatus Micrarchaeota archaeon]